ncbi:MAG: cofactor-independent phosphoglycerate mutase [Lentisphaerae bacterium]|nr:cofactor-independent phosphoglycerate mutase [Lentisphaerota bacterium]
MRENDGGRWTGPSPALPTTLPSGIMTRMSNYKTIVFLADGMADERLPELGDRTPLEAANTPAMDRIANRGRCGTLLTLPEGFPTSSEVANMSVLGCDLATEYCGRGPLEAAGRGISLAAGDVAFRLNLTTEEKGILRDYSGGRVTQDESSTVIEALNAAFGRPGVRFATGVSYRCLLILSGQWASAAVQTHKPDDHQDDKVADFLPDAISPAGAETAMFLARLVREAPAVLKALPLNRKRRRNGQPPVNGVWPWNGGRGGSMRTLHDKYGISSAVISAVDVINGLGRMLGMEVIRVEGATGYIDTNYEGKADAALEALSRHDFVYVHVEGIDEVSHEGSLELKLRAIEDFDKRLVSRVVHRMPENTAVAVLPDHPVPVHLRKHTREPVPVAIMRPDWAPDRIKTYNEILCKSGTLGMMRGEDFMRTLLS